MTQVNLEKAGDVATVRFSSEKGIQVFSSPVVERLGDIAADLCDDGDVRFVVLRGTGRTFLAGADIKEMSGLDVEGGRRFAERGHRAFDAVERLPQVTIAVINGHALGGGCELSLACDFRLAVAGAKLGQPETRLGLIPGWGGTTRLPRIIGRSRALRLMFSGEQVTAEAARELGLVDEVAADEAGLDAALAAWCDALRHGSPSAIARLKEAIRDNSEVEEFSRCFKDADSGEGMKAFVEKRAARWMPAS